MMINHELIHTLTQLRLHFDPSMRDVYIIYTRKPYLRPKPLFSLAPPLPHLACPQTFPGIFDVSLSIFMLAPFPHSQIHHFPISTPTPPTNPFQNPKTFRYDSEPSPDTPSANAEN